MKTAEIKASKKYSVTVGSGALDLLAESLYGLGFNPLENDVFAVSDTNVFPLYGERVLKLLGDAGYKVNYHVIKAGESSKTPEVLFEILEKMAEDGLSRDSLVLALGGGVVGDISALSSALYMRGIPCVMIPTSLLAMVDSSLGGKTAVDLKAGKNLAGVFCQPASVICDTSLLSTLPEREYTNGMAEVIKYAAIGCDVEPDEKNIDELVYSCVKAKAYFIEKDELDKGIRRFLNYGHTFGHAIEKLSGYTIPHGFAIALGMTASSEGAFKLGLCDAKTVNKTKNVLNKFGLGGKIGFSPEEIAKAVFNDKKRHFEKNDIIVPESFGKVRVLSLTDKETEEFIRKALS